MADITDYTSIYSYEYILARALSRVSDNIDKRQGSIIYDAIAPACQELANAYVEMQGILNQTFALTCQGGYQDLRYAENGLVRNPATESIRKATFVNNEDDPAYIELGSRFSTISETVPINYIILAEYKEDGVVIPGAYQIQCGETGSVGNDYVGNIIPLDYIPNLKSAYMADILVPGEDVESDDDFRVRYFLDLVEKSFGGNIAQYREWTQAIEGVGPVQVYPTWDGGGTVKVSILDSNYSKASTELIAIVQNSLDPDEVPENQGQGLGTAPIGHVVTVAAPTEVEVSVSATVVLKTGYTKPQVEPLILESLQNYFTEIRKAWGNSDNLNNYQVGVYISKTIYMILNTTGVENVSDVLLNESNEDIILTETKTTQQIPILGEVTIN